MLFGVMCHNVCSILTVLIDVALYDMYMWSFYDITSVFIVWQSI